MEPRDMPTMAPIEREEDLVAEGEEVEEAVEGVGVVGVDVDVVSVVD